jgi:arylsulfatase A-like enzyme
MSSPNRRILSLLAAVFLLALSCGILLALSELISNGYIRQGMFLLAILRLRDCVNISFLVFPLILPLFLLAARARNCSKERLLRLAAAFLACSLLLFSVVVLFRRVTNYSLLPAIRFLHRSLSDPDRREPLLAYLADFLSRNTGLVVRIGLILFGALLLIPVFLVLSRRLDWTRIAKPFRGTRIRKVAAGLLVALACLNVSVFFHQKTVRPTGPDIILIYLDALRADHLGCYGYHRDTSPSIDRLAGAGVLFRNVVSQASSTFPSVHSGLTSKYASTFLDAHACLPAKHLTLAECLKNHGYRTLAISSSPVVTKSNTTHSLGGFEQGFDLFDESVAYGVDWNWQWRSPEGVVEKALGWIEKSDRPFFLFLYIMDPHSDYRCPEPYHSRFDPDYRGRKEVEDGQMAFFAAEILKGSESRLDRRDIEHFVALYDGEVAYADSEIGRLLKSLEKRNRLDETLVVLTSDHGEEFLEHGGVHHGYTLYNEVTRVPLVVRYPPQIPQSRVIDDRLVQSIDMAPTILEIAGIEKPAGMQGESLMPLIRNSEASWREYALSETPFTDMKALTKGKWKYIYSLGTRPLAPVHRITQAQGGRLYNLEEDPGELRDVYSENPELARDLHAILLGLLPEAERNRLGENQEIEMHTHVKEQLKSLGYLQ